ncbi:hypothetical protein F4778DRAFT_403688 [Xylariomycetidae sp. FL2044]|nr:hypothetical protein F4778DRAFT_403688 [Xylariomycetidae sp. FL2044]
MFRPFRLFRPRPSLLLRPPARLRKPRRSSCSQIIPLRSTPLPSRSPLLRPFSTTRWRLEAPPRPSQQPEDASSTSPSNSSTTPSPLEPPAPQTHHRSTAPPPRRRSRGLYYSVLFLLAGVSLGTLFRHTVAPPALPEPGTQLDDDLVQRIRSRGDALPLVRALSADPSWTSWHASSGMPAAQRAARLTSGALSGARGLAYQRVFHNAATGEVINVVYFGPGTSGWPGVVHGGALATVLDESLGRCAILRFPARTGVTARLEISYKSPTPTGGFHVIRARPLAGSGDDAVGPAERRKLWVEGHLESEQGRVCVLAKALFVVPKSFELKPLIEGF